VWIRTVDARVFDCPHGILKLEHYGDDGTCRCDEPLHREQMIRWWGFKETDFPTANVKEAYEKIRPPDREGA
jgi:hypothetical protein